MLIDLFVHTLALAGTFCTLIGMLTVWFWILKPPKPNDQSNRINNIQSWWVGLTRPDVLGKSYKHFKLDVMGQIKNENE